MRYIGTIKHVQLAAITHNREAIARYRALARTPSNTFNHPFLCFSLIISWTAGYQDSYDTYLEKSTAEIEALQDWCCYLSKRLHYLCPSLRFGVHHRHVHRNRSCTYSELCMLLWPMIFCYTASAYLCTNLLVVRLTMNKLSGRCRFDLQLHKKVSIAEVTNATIGIIEGWGTNSRKIIS